MYKHLLDRILEQLNHLLPHDVADVLLVNKGIVRSVRWRGYEQFGLQDSIQSVTYDLDDTTNLRTIQETGRPLAIPNVEQYEKWVARPGLDWIKSQASAPIRISDRVVGFLNINSATPDLYSQQDAERLQAFADHAAIALENTRLHSHARQAVFKHQETEKTLQETLQLIERAKREWETTVDSLSQLICLLDREGKVVRANRTVTRWGLAQVTKVKGKNFHELLHPDCSNPDCYLTSCWTQAWDKLAQSQPVECEADDEILKRSLHIQIRRISAAQAGERNGAASNFAVVVVNDITARKRTEEELRRTQAKHQALIHAIPDLMLQISRDGTLLDVIPAQDVTLPFLPEEILGKNVSDVFPPKSAEDTIRYVNRALQTCETQVFEYQLLVGEQMRDYEVRLVAGTNDEVLSLVRDITARKQTEEELKRYQDHLEEIIDERSVLLLKANERLQQEIEERKQVEEELRRRNQELALLNHIVVGSAADLGLETLLETTCRELAPTFGLPQVRAVLLNDNQTEGTIAAECLAEPDCQFETAPPSTIPVADNAAYQYLLEHKTVLVVDNARVPGERELEPVCKLLLQQGLSSLLMLPLIAADEVRGVISIASPEPHHFSEEEIDLGRVVADHLSDALAQTRSE